MKKWNNMLTAQIEVLQFSLLLEEKLREFLELVATKTERLQSSIVGEHGAFHFGDIIFVDGKDFQVFQLGEKAEA